MRVNLTQYEPNKTLWLYSFVNIWEYSSPKNFITEYQLLCDYSLYSATSPLHNNFTFTFPEVHSSSVHNIIIIYTDIRNQPS